MRIILKSLHLLNFKGVRDFRVDFNKEITNISGDNGTGKSTLFDSFTYLLFGKDSHDVKDFNIKTLDSENNVIPRIDHQVTGVLEIDGDELTLRKLYKEKWVKKKGSETPEFSGHTTEYYFNDVPLSQKEYEGNIDGIISESIAKLVTNPLYFNQMLWTKRREVLSKMAGDVTDKDVAGQNEDFIALLALLNNKSLEEFKKEIAAKKKKLKDSLEQIPVRISEANLSMPQVENWNKIESQIEMKNKDIEAVEKQMDDKTLSHQTTLNGIRDKQNELHDLKLKLSGAEQSAKSDKQSRAGEVQNTISSKEGMIRSIRGEIDTIARDISSNNNTINKLTEENNKSRTEWLEINSRTLVIDEKQFNCPTCQRPLESSNIDELRTSLTDNFTKDKLSKLTAISEKGEGNKKRIESLTTSTAMFEKAKEGFETQIENLNTEVFNLKIKKKEIEAEVETESAEVTELKKKIESFVVPAAPIIDNTELKNQRTQLTNDRDALKTKLNNKEQITKLNTRIADLEADEKKLSQELASLEKTEFIIAAFNKTKIEAIERRINDKFKVVRFKMFEEQINGGEVESCECLVNGVPYSDVNKASQMNAGLDIINALTEHYEVYAPIWIDNRESINEIIPCKSQIVNLLVTKDVKLVIS